jgi:hypothetical protein
VSYAAQDQFFAAPPYQYRVSKAPVCPLVVVGKRCRVGYPRGDWCVCQRFHHWLDHGRSWLAPDGSHVVTGEPYGIHDDEDWAQFAAACDALGIDITIDAEHSPWYPGHTTLVLLRRRP